MPRKGENIYKRKDGRWEGRYIKARSKTGKAVYGYVYAPTYKEAKRKRSQAIINIEANQTTICKVPETTMPTCFIRKLANDWMNSIQSQIKKSSYVKYYNILHTYILPEFDNVPLSELTSSRIQKFCDDLLTHGSSSGEGLSPKTVLDILSLVRSLLRYAQIQGYQPPSTGKEIIIRQTAPDTVVIPRSSQDILCRYLYANMSERNLGILLCLFTGMRVGEICALKWEDFISGKIYPCPQHNAAAANSRFHHRTENPYYGYIAQKQMFYPYNSNSRQSNPAHSEGISQQTGICPCRCK